MPCRFSVAWRATFTAGSCTCPTSWWMWLALLRENRLQCVDALPVPFLRHLQVYACTFVDDHRVHTCSMQRKQQLSRRPSRLLLATTTDGVCVCVWASASSLHGELLLWMCACMCLCEACNLYEEELAVPRVLTDNGGEKLGIFSFSSERTL